MYVINHILYAESYCLQPTVIMARDYTQKPVWWDGRNPWEMFFCPIVAPESLDVYCLSKDQVFPGIHVKSPWAVRSFGYGYGNPGNKTFFNERWYRSNRKRAARVVQDYYILQPRVQKALAKRWTKLGISPGTKLFGLHYRGGDVNTSTTDDREVFAPVDRYLPYVQAFLRAFPDGRVLVATDDFNAQKAMLDGSWPSDVKKALKMPRPMTSETAAERDFGQRGWVQAGPYKRGVLVLLDVLMLSRCDFLIYPQSTTAESVFYFNFGLHDRSIPIWARNQPPAQTEWFRNESVRSEWRRKTDGRRRRPK